MAIIPLKAWYLEQYEPIRDTLERSPDLRLSRNSLLKSGMRADFLEEKETIEAADWFERYLRGETVEFYIEGSGGYAIANIDLISHEIYFIKQKITSWLEPTIFFSGQESYAASQSAIESALTESLDQFNQRSRLPIQLTTIPHSAKKPLRLSESQMRRIQHSLLFIADATPLVATDNDASPLFLLSPFVTVELGYALAHKKPGQVLMLQMQRPELSGVFPFDLPQHRQLGFKTERELSKMLPSVLEMLLQRYHLLS